MRPFTKINFFQRVMLMFMLLHPPFIQAEDHPVVPEELPGVKLIMAEQVLAMVESGSLLLIDTRKSSDFNLGSIPRAINCPTESSHHRLDEDEIRQAKQDLMACPAVQKADHSQPTALYCNGLHCWRSAKGALALKQLGFAKVYWYREGMNDWKTQGFPME